LESWASRSWKRQREAEIQSIQEKKIMKNIDDLVVAVREAYWEGHRNTLSLQQSMMGVLEAKGDNTKSVKHMKKNKLRREGKLPVSIKCEPYLIAAGHEQLDGPAPQLGDPIRPLGDITNTSSSSRSNTNTIQDI
jgi:hypothetical protein